MCLICGRRRPRKGAVRPRNKRDHQKGSRSKYVKCHPVRLKGGPGWQIYFDSPSLFKAIVHQKREQQQDEGGGMWRRLLAMKGNEPPTYCTLERGRFLTFTALPLVFRKEYSCKLPRGVLRTSRLSRIPPPLLMGAPYKALRSRTGNWPACGLQKARVFPPQPAYLQPAALLYCLL